MKLHEDEFGAFADYIKSVSGVCYEAQQISYLESLLLPLALRCKAETFMALLQQVKTDPIGALVDELMDLVTIHETLFFREQACFTLLGNQLIPEALSRSEAGIKIWSAGCSTGQEPFSLALTATERIGLADVHRYVSILATDISKRSLVLASEAEYRDYEMNRGLPQVLRQKYFNRVKDYWKLDDSVRSLVCFEQNNLVEAPPQGGPFDIILLRNVAIYFDPQTTQEVYRKVIAQLKPGGCLVLGGTELLKADSFDVQRHVACAYPYFQRQPSQSPGLNEGSNARLNV